MSKITFGLPLGRPSTQTILPVMGKPSARIYGFLIIQAETFDGTETAYATNDGEVPVETVTLPTYGIVSGGRANIGRTHSPQVQQYMAAVWDDNLLVRADYNRGTAISNPWLGLTQFISADDGFYQRYIQAPNSNFVERLQLGTLIDSLVYGMAITNAAPPAPTPPDVQDATMSWTAKIGQYALVGECPYFDINWQTLFESKYQLDCQNVPVPQRLTVDTVPSGFKAFLVNRPTTIAGSNLTYDTLRIVVIDDTLETGDYVFNFTIATDLGSVPVVFTLTVTAVHEAATS